MKWGWEGTLVLTQGLRDSLLIWGKKEHSKKRRTISQPCLDRFPNLNSESYGGNCTPPDAILVSRVEKWEGRWLEVEAVS